MDAKARNKALFRAKLNAQKKEKRIDSPLVRSVFSFPFFFLSICLVIDITKAIVSSFYVLNNVH